MDPANTVQAATVSTSLYAVARRAEDVVVAALALVILSPLVVITGVAIRLTSRGPAIFAQQRLGEGGRIFTCYKFRTMYVDGHESRAVPLENHVEGPVFKMRRDPRVTPIGSRLRRLSIDEVPQLVNVLLGHMSLVGPRPPLPSEAAEYDSRAMQRLTVKPGLTCLWQVNGRSEVGFERWIEYDLEYVRRRGFWFDQLILLRTIPAVLSGRGAW